MAAKDSTAAKDAKRLSRIGSEVNAMDASGQVFKGFYVWSDVAPAVKEDPDLMFAKCLVQPGSTKAMYKLKQAWPDDPTQTVFDSPQANTYNCNQNIDPLAFPDIGMIPHTNVAAVLDFIRQRYTKGQIYVTADPLLLAVNPFKDLGNTTDAIIKQYRDAVDVSKLPPHVFATARTALENLHSVKKSQTIIVSGESGAGKTEATKQIMRYFAAAKSGNVDLRIQKAVLAGNPVLEAFGNAKTIRNNNSSRFGRFMQLQVAAGGGIEYGTIKNFLLEKSRIVTQDSEERSYHIFYQLIKGATPEMKTKFKLKTLNDYKNINPKCPDAPGINDLEEWKDVLQSLDSMKMNAEEKDSLFSIISGVMLMGNVELKGQERQGVPDAATIINKDVWGDACGLFYLDPLKVEEGITMKFSVAAGQEIKSVWGVKDAQILKDSLAKAMYDSLFNWSVMKLNGNIEPPSGFSAFMGMLDIFGFEVFKNNSLEQLFINITNEMLQKNFIDVVFERETNLYRAEGISSATLTWTTNAEIIECLCAKKNSVMQFLEDACLAPGGSDEKFLSAAAGGLGSNPKFQKAKVSSNVNFIICHTIGDIQYNVNGFLNKNKDVLRSELVELCQKSENKVTAALFAGVVAEKGKIAKGQLIGSQFMLQLKALMDLINSTEPHFIRCLKPNDEKAALKFTSSKVLVQLHSLSILEALQLRNLGYSYRRVFEEFIQQFRFLNLGVAEDKSLDPATAARKLLEGAKAPTEGWQIGKTMVFLKHDTLKYLTVKQREMMAAWEPLVVVLEAMYRKYAMKKEIDKRLPGLIRVQAHIRTRNRLSAH